MHYFRQRHQRLRKEQKLAAANNDLTRENQVKARIDELSRAEEAVKSDPEAQTAADVPSEEDLAGKTVDELRKQASGLDISGYSSLRKDELIAAIRAELINS